MARLLTSDRPDGTDAPAAPSRDPSKAPNRGDQPEKGQAEINRVTRADQLGSDAERVVLIQKERASLSAVAKSRRIEAAFRPREPRPSP